MSYFHTKKANEILTQKLKYQYSLYRLQYVSKQCRLLINVSQHLVNRTIGRMCWAWALVEVGAVYFSGARAPAKNGVSNCDNIFLRYLWINWEICWSIKLFFFFDSLTGVSYRQGTGNGIGTVFAISKESCKFSPYFVHVPYKP